MGELGLHGIPRDSQFEHGWPLLRPHRQLSTSAEEAMILAVAERRDGGGLYALSFGHLRSVLLSLFASRHGGAGMMGFPMGGLRFLCLLRGELRRSSVVGLDVYKSA